MSLVSYIEQPLALQFYQLSYCQYKKYNQNVVLADRSFQKRLHLPWKKKTCLKILIKASSKTKITRATKSESKYLGQSFSRSCELLIDSSLGLTIAQFPAANAPTKGTYFIKKT